MNKKITNRIFSKDYVWGSGFFRDIASIRRKVYTVQYLEEHEQILSEILSVVPRKHINKLLDEIEKPEYFIDSKRYEEIKAYLWNRSKREFSVEIGGWEKKINKNIIECASAQVNIFDKFFAGFDNVISVKKILLTLISLNLFPITRKYNEAGIKKEISKMFEFGNSTHGINGDIDFNKKFFEKVINNPSKLAFVAGDVNTVTFELKLLESLIDFWLSKRPDKDFSVSLFVNKKFRPKNNNGVIQINSTLQNIESLLKQDIFKKLNQYKEKNYFKVVSFNSDFGGMVLTDLDDKVQEELINSEIVIGSGENNLITTHGVNKNSFYLFPIRDFSTIFFISLSWKISFSPDSLKKIIKSSFK